MNIQEAKKIIDIKFPSKYWDGLKPQEVYAHQCMAQGYIQGWNDRIKSEEVNGLKEALERIDKASQVYAYKSPEEGFNEILVIFSANIHQRCFEALSAFEKGGKND